MTAADLANLPAPTGNPKRSSTYVPPAQSDYDAYVAFLESVRPDDDDARKYGTGFTAQEDI